MHALARFNWFPVSRLQHCRNILTMCNGALSNALKNSEHCRTLICNMEALKSNEMYQKSQFRSASGMWDDVMRN